MKILIVDDNAINRKLPSVLLSKAGHQVVEADSGELGLELLAKEPFDFMLLDVSMPGMSGEEVCQQIRANPSYCGLRVVAYTAHAMKEERDRILSSGFDELLVKPINRDSLFAVLPKLG